MFCKFVTTTTLMGESHLESNKDTKQKVTLKIANAGICSVLLLTRLLVVGISLCD